jgi:hypothetical protein
VRVQGREDKRGSGIVKMQNPESVTKLLGACEDGVLKIKSDHGLKLEELKGEEEVEWWKQDSKAMADKHAAGGGQKRKASGGGRGRGRGRGRGSKRGRS